MTPTTPTDASRRSRRGAVPLLDRPLDRLIGRATATQLAKQGVTTARRLLRLFPRRYDTWGDLTDLRTLKDGEQATIQAQVVRAAARRTRGGRPPALLEATVTDGATTMDLVMFGNPGQMHHHAEQLAPGTTVLLSGKVGLHRGRRQLAVSRFQVLDELDDAEREALLARPMPIYPATEAIPSWMVARAVRTVLDQIGPHDVPEPLPEQVRSANRLVDAYTAYQWVHAPEETSQWRAARRRLRHEEAFVLQAVFVSGGFSTPPSTLPSPGRFPGPTRCWPTWTLPCRIRSPPDRYAWAVRSPMP